jgi:hypothetical protein
VEEEERMRKGIRSIGRRRRIKNRKTSRKKNILNFLFSSSVGFSQLLGGKTENSKGKGNIKSVRIIISHLLTCRTV